MEAGGNVKGSVLLSRLAFLSRQGGDALVRRVLARLPSDDGTLLAGMLMPFAWYPFALNARLDVAIAGELARGDRTFLELGAASADDNLRSASQRQYMHERNPHGLLRQASSIYRVYYDTGQREYERASDHRAVLRTRDSLSFSVADCATVLGWHVRAIEMCGGRNASGTHPQCRALGATLCEYVFTWE